ncbi:unnamed protein product [Polarella glacialis]|uniref:carnosine N-methyltransferase n=1 Tax=Polarella glacialis TaxID=89957 RepID=A0A813E007_POLGL|nr:unnamed protein product [Polarella glacialis]
MGGPSKGHGRGGAPQPNLVSAAGPATGYGAPVSAGTPYVQGPAAYTLPQAQESGSCKGSGQPVLPGKGHSHGHQKGAPAQKGSGKGVGQEEDDEDDDDDDEDDDDCDEECCVDEDRQHFADVCYSLVDYGRDAHADLQCMEDSFSGITDPHDRALLLPPGADIMRELRVCAKINARFLSTLVQTDEDASDFSSLPAHHQVHERNSVKVRTVLRQFVRDWADEGAQERETQYGPLLEAMERHVPLPGPPGKGKQVRRPRVLCPGSGLSRLPFEVARRGYGAQGNEFSYHMLQGSKWVLNETSKAKSHIIYPYLLNLENRKTARDQVRGVKIPDICPGEVLCPPGVQTSPQDFSMCAGEFVEVYHEQKNEWDAVLTCFFIDTAKNIFLYIRTIADIIRPGGLWANIGPLLFHYAEQPAAISIELSWEEIKPAIAKYFDFREEEMRFAYYTTNERGLMRTRYRCIYFAAIRNKTPTDGHSHPVF